jgi:hypothetical protein
MIRNMTIASLGLFWAASRRPWRGGGTLRRHSIGRWRGVLDRRGCRHDGAADMMALTPVNLRSVALVAAGCDDIAIGAGATLIEIARDKPDLVVHAQVLTGGGTEREVEEKNAFAALCPATDVRLTVADLPSGRLSDHRGRVKKLLAEFRQDCAATPKPSRSRSPYWVRDPIAR